MWMSIASCFVCGTFIARWCFVCSEAHVRLGWSRHVSFFFDFPAHDLPFIPYFSLSLFLFSFLFCFLFFLCGISSTRSSLPYRTLFLTVNSSSISGKSFAPSSFHSFMVGYSLVRRDCPFISFIFTCLCGLLEFVGRQRPGVRLFVGRDCPYRFVLLFLFPLVHCSVGIAQTLIMFGEEIRWSELETGLSSSKNRGVLEVLPSSTPHKAWRICCSLKEMDEKRIKNRFQFPSSIKVKIPDDDNRACHSYANEVCFYEVDFVSGLRFPVHLFVREIFFHLFLAPA